MLTHAKSAISGTTALVLLAAFAAGRPSPAPVATKTVAVEPIKSEPARLLPLVPTEPPPRQVRVIPLTKPLDVVAIPPLPEPPVPFAEKWAIVPPIKKGAPTPPTASAPVAPRVVRQAAGEIVEDNDAKLVKRRARDAASDICRGKGKHYSNGGRSWRCNRR
jgi:hypothetical protein